jgi:hypothetical protein
MNLDFETRKEIFRKVAGTAIENSHGAIKQVWVALFAGGTFALISSFDTLMTCAGLFDHPDFRNSAEYNRHCVELLNGINGHWSLPELGKFLLLVSLYIVYVLTFYRFYVGNVRVFDMRYIEVGKFIALLYDDTDRNEPEERRKQKHAARHALYQEFYEYIDENTRWLDSIFLMFKTLVIISLTIEVNTPKIFLSIYLAILIFDIVWMLSSKRSKALFAEKILEKIMLTSSINLSPDRRAIKQLQKIFPTKAITFWTINNSVFAVVLLLIVLMIFRDRFSYLPRLTVDELCLYWLGAIAMLANCLIDLAGTRLFYNPKFRDAYVGIPPDASAESPPAQ